MTFKKYISSTLITFIALIILTGCGEKSVQNVEITTPNDNLLDCSGISTEFAENEQLFLTTIKERNQEIGKGVARGIGGVFIIPNSVFTGEESPRSKKLTALRQRNDVLKQLARTKKCAVPTSKLTEFYKKIDANKVK